MSSWSKNRQRTYAIIVIVVVVGAIGIPIFKTVYKAPTCSDGIQNGNETGVDCGGSCQRLCQSAFLPPDIAWTRFEELVPGLYNIAAYVINPNTTGEAIAAPYHMAVYDSSGILITDVNGRVTLPPHRNTLAFQSAVSLGKRIPAKVLFEFTSAPDWHSRTDPLSAIQIADKQYNEDTSGSSLLVTVGNESVVPVRSVAVYAVLSDKDGNTLGFSRTILDEVPPKSTVQAPFTWPMSHGGKVVSIEVLPVQE